MEHVLVQPVKVVKERQVLSQAQKFQKGLQLSQELASLASEGGIPTFTKRYELLKEVIKYWKLGAEVELFPMAEKGIATKSSQQNCQDLDNLQSINVKSHEDLSESFLLATDVSSCLQGLEVSKPAESSTESFTESSTESAPNRKSEYNFSKGQN